jgi:hypothetical protein
MITGFEFRNALAYFLNDSRPVVGILPIATR